MGYDKVNLYGMSLGPRLAMIVMRDHPRGLRSVVLDSVLPPEVQHPGSDPVGVQAALKTLFKECAADAGCNKAYPDLEAAFNEVAGRLRAAPAQVEVTTEKGERVKVTVDDLSFAEYVLEGLSTGPSRRCRGASTRPRAGTTRPLPKPVWPRHGFGSRGR